MTENQTSISLLLIFTTIFAPTTPAFAELLRPDEWQVGRREEPEPSVVEAMNAFNELLQLNTSEVSLLITFGLASGKSFAVGQKAQFEADQLQAKIAKQVSTLEELKSLLLRTDKILREAANRLSFYANSAPHNYISTHLMKIDHDFLRFINGHWERPHLNPISIDWERRIYLLKRGVHDMRTGLINFQTHFSTLPKNELKKFYRINDVQKTQQSIRETLDALDKVMEINHALDVKPIHKLEMAKGEAALLKQSRLAKWAKKVGWGFLIIDGIIILNAYLDNDEPNQLVDLFETQSNYVRKALFTNYPHLKREVVTLNQAVKELDTEYVEAMEQVQNG